jgi:hypothetical protein
MFLGGKGLTTLPPFVSRFLENVGARCLTTLSIFAACYRDTFTFKSLNTSLLVLITKMCLENKSWAIGTSTSLRHLQFIVYMASRAEEEKRGIVQDL